MAGSLNPQLAAGPSADVGPLWNAFNVGQSLARMPTGSGAPENDGDPTAWPAVLGGLPVEHRAAAVDAALTRAEQLAHVLLGLKAYPPEARLSLARHLAETSGLLDPGSIAPGDVTDLGIGLHLQQIAAAARQLQGPSGATDAGQTPPFPNTRYLGEIA
jgi:hypothetical protein